ncbi:hypothetical protein Tco_0635603 [Tanacetum coccineum]
MHDKLQRLRDLATTTMITEKCKIPEGNAGLLLLLSAREQDFCCLNVEFFENSLMIQEASGSHGLLESNGSDGVLIRRSARIPQAPDRYGFYVDVEEYELGDLNEPPNYKAALSDPEFDK